MITYEVKYELDQLLKDINEAMDQFEANQIEKFNEHSYETKDAVDDLEEFVNHKHTFVHVLKVLLIGVIFIAFSRNMNRRALAFS